MAGTYVTKSPCTCAICGETFDFQKKLTNHISKEHKLKSLDYTIKHLYNGKRPSCPVCDSETKYVSLGFKKYCIAHANVAMKEAGRIGGTMKKTWSKNRTKDNHLTLKEFSDNHSGEGNPFFGKRHPEELQKKITEKLRLPFDEVLRRVTATTPDVALLSSKDDYLNKMLTKLHVVCKQCNTEDYVTLANIERCWRCRVCHPNGSRKQIDIFRWIKEDLGFADAVCSDRSVISPLELDIWIPSKNIAIEYHGLYWHSGDVEDTFIKERHLEKYTKCKEKGIRLLQFFDDEFQNTPEICMSMIKNALGVIGTKLNARDCELKEISTEDAKEFLQNNHIAGYTRSSVKFGLIHPQHGLVSVATLRTPIQKKWGSVIELARMASKTGIVVRGGASKLLNACVNRGKEMGFEGILSYSELRYGEGHTYEKCGFEFKTQTGKNYWYTDGKKRYDRFKFRAQDGLTETDYAVKMGVRAVWGVGNAVYVKQF